jgi:hemerythrin
MKKYFNRIFYFLAIVTGYNAYRYRLRYIQYRKLNFHRKGYIKFLENQLDKVTKIGIDSNALSRKMLDQYDSDVRWFVEHSDTKMLNAFLKRVEERQKIS